MVWISILAAAITVGVGLRIREWVRRRQRPAPPRRVEEPNSFYSAPGVRRLMAQERWGQIPIDRLHPINREEVERLLRLVDAAGFDALSPKERVFLDTLGARRTG